MVRRVYVVDTMQQLYDYLWKNGGMTKRFSKDNDVVFSEEEATGIKEHWKEKHIHCSLIDLRNKT